MQAPPIYVFASILSLSLSLSPLSITFMSDQNPNPPEHQSEAEPKARPVGSTEYSWCRAVPTGTGITVSALLFSKPPDLSNLQKALHTLQISHPILLSKLHHPLTTAATPTFSFITPISPHLQITAVDLSSTSLLLQTLSPNSTTTPFHTLLEHELNKSPWFDPTHPSYTDADVMFSTVYALEDDKWVVVLRLHTAACDRTSAVTLMRDMMGLMGGGGEIETENEDEGEVSLEIESFIPNGKANKPFWARGVDVLGYSLNSLRLWNLNFMDAGSPRFSQMVRLQMSSRDTDQILNGCKSRGIKLCGVLSAAALIAARSSKGLPDQKWEKYAVVTLLDCRSILDPPLSTNHFGFYYSAILNTHDIKGGEELWELARRMYTAFADAKDRDKHFSDMADTNFLMCKAIENPGLTPSSSLRTSLISVFEEPVIDHSNEKHQEIGLEDYVDCGSVHGVGPSIAVFDTIRDGQLDCVCVYPSPLHSREQMQELVESMKQIIVDGCLS